MRNDTLWGFGEWNISFTKMNVKSFPQNQHRFIAVFCELALLRYIKSRVCNIHIRATQPSCVSGFQVSVTEEIYTHIIVLFAYYISTSVFSRLLPRTEKLL